ncbi:MAG: helix-turn-helix domain-containing protein [Natronomonas sp.]
MQDLREQLAERIAGEVTLSDDPGATLRKWREEFDITQTTLAAEIGVSPSVVSDYESGRRDSPGIGVVRRAIEGLLAIDERRGGERLRQHARVISSGFDRDIVYDLREYARHIPLSRFLGAVDATEIAAGRAESIAGHTVINSVEAITRLTSEEFYRLYGQSTNRALVFTDVTRGESPLVALRVVQPTPSAVVLHGIEEADLWEHAPKLAQADGVSLSTTTLELDAMLERLRELS